MFKVDGICEYSSLDKCTGVHVKASRDDSVWNDICAMLRDDKWLESQLGEEQTHLVDRNKLILLEENKIRQSKQKLTRIQDRWEKGIYTESEAGVKVKEFR